MSTDAVETPKSLEGERTLSVIRSETLDVYVVSTMSFKTFVKSEES